MERGKKRTAELQPRLERRCRRQTWRRSKLGVVNDSHDLGSMQLNEMSRAGGDGSERALKEDWTRHGTGVTIK